ncbi:MAG: DegT/DnrJ/EryC1/StrS family aminotransferase [Bacteroidales bacterium]|nr:DegT/DnrJ/EryC1/StrS family aminotransferase [Bacteroidales bacterium]
MQFRDLHRQYEAMKAEMDETMLRVVASGAYIMGPQVAELEQQLADYVGVKHCITCANGTDALRLSLMALGVGPGDAVFVPDFTFFATAEAVAMVGATPIFIDVDKETYNIDPCLIYEEYESVRCNTSLRPVAVIAVDLFGLPADYDVLREVCRCCNIFLVEDGAQGFGGSFGGKRACSFGDISATSFFPAKPLGCYGDGGAIFTDDEHYADLLRSLRVHGKGTDKYDNVRLGLNSRLDTMQAAVLQVKLRYFDDELLAVNRVAAKYSQLLRGKIQTPVVPEGYTSSWAQYTIQAENRDELQARLKTAGIPSMVYYPHTMSRQTAFEGLPKLTLTPTADQLTRTVLSLPMHPYMTDEEIQTVASLI